MDLSRRTVLGNILRRLTAALVALVVLALLLVVASGWYYSNQLLPAAEPEDAGQDVEVERIDPTAGTITLHTTEETPAHDVADLTSSAVLGFEFEGGYLQLLDILEGDGLSATRRFEVIAGDIPEVNDRGDLEAYAFPDDPAALGIPVEEVTVPGPLGDLPAWLFGQPREDGTWAVLVHGRGGTRTETFRGVQILDQIGIPSLAVTYRNDPEAPASPDGYGHFGDTEWEDVQAAMEWLVQHRDADRLVLYGYSQGGGIVATTLRRSPDTERVAAAILDSPLLSLHATLEREAANRGIPQLAVGPLLAATKAIADWRSGLDFSALEHLAAGDEFDVPMLVFHGKSDTTVPFRPSELLSEQRGDIVKFVPYAGEHVRGWNVDPDKYTEAVHDFLAGVL